MHADPKRIAAAQSAPVHPVYGLVLRGRPKLRALDLQCPTDVVVTCLTEHEGGLRIVDAVRAIDKEPLWLPFTFSTVTQADLPRLAAGTQQVASRLHAGETVTIHCSAGLHRTGVIAYASLRRTGLTGVETERVIAAARQQTADELPRHLDLATVLAEWPLTGAEPRA